MRVIVWQMLYGARQPVKVFCTMFSGGRGAWWRLAVQGFPQSEPPPLFRSLYVATPCENVYKSLLGVYL